MIVARRCAVLLVFQALLIGALMTANNANAASTEEELKALKEQFSLLQQQIQLSQLQATQSASTNAAILTALKGVVSAQSDLDKAKAQGEFASLAGMKAGLDSVGAPLGKDGKITVTTGTVGALMLSLREPMLKGLATHAKQITKRVKEVSPEGVYLGTDAHVQSALQAVITQDAVKRAADALDKTQKAIGGTGTRVSAAVAAEFAAAGLFLNTLVGFERFFRVDTSYALFDAGEEAQQTLTSMLQRTFKDEEVPYHALGTIDIEKVTQTGDKARKSLEQLKSLHDAGAELATEIDKLKADDPKRPAKDLVARLKDDLATVKSLIDTLHPASKPEGFWGYVQGLVSNEMMQAPSGKYLNRLVMNAKAQAIQIVESRVFGSDKIHGKSDIQIEFKLLSSDGKLLDSGLTLATYSAAGDSVDETTFNFPEQ